MNESGKEDLYAKNGKLLIDKPGDYGNVVVSGKLIADTPFSADNLRVNGKMSASSDINVKELSLTGKAEINGSLSADTIKIDGKIIIDKRLIVYSLAKITGKMEVSEELSGHDEVSEFTLTGKLEVPTVTTFGFLSITGKVDTESIKQIKELKIYGGIEAEDISASNVTISLSGESQVSKLYADKIEIGRDIGGKGEKNISAFGFNLNFKGNSGFMEIDEIHCTGVVELDHVSVNKVYAKELYAGEETEIGEFIELVEK